MKTTLHFFNGKAKSAFFLTLSFALANVAMAQTKVTGTLVGTAGSWNNVAANTKEAAVDNAVSTFFDAPASALGIAYVGYDLGVNNQVLLSSVKFFPRNGNTTSFPDRMGGTKIYGTNDPTKVGTTTGDLLYTFPAAVTTGTYYQGNYRQIVIDGGSTLVEFTFTPPTATKYRYVYWYSINNGNVGEIEFWGTTSTLGLEDMNIVNNKFKVYPNPSTVKFFNIDLGSGYANDTVEVKVYGLLGNLVLEKTLNTAVTKIDHNLSAGTYIVKVGNSATKLIVK